MLRGSAIVDLDASVGESERVIELVDLALTGLDAAPDLALVLAGIEIDTDVSRSVLARIAAGRARPLRHPIILRRPRLALAACMMGGIVSFGHALC